MIVGIGHVARVGKDIAAGALSRDLGFKRVAFADKLKELAILADPIVTGATQATNVGAGKGRLAWVVQGMGYDEAKSVYPEVRKFLQDLGAGARDVFGEDFWIEQALGPRKAKTHPSSKADIVVSDVRYRNEAEEISERGGKMIRIDRPGYAPHGHISETDLAGFEGWDAVIENVGTVQDLEAKVVNLVKEWQGDS